MALGLIAGLTAKASIELFLAGAGAAVTLLCTGSKVRKRR